MWSFFSRGEFIIKKIYIFDVKKKSIAYDVGIKKGDFLLSLNGNEIKDILDYKFNMTDSYIEVKIEHEKGDIEIYEIEKDYDEDLGLEFESELIDKPKRCYNNCIFCFMNQLPKDVRETLIFKDDDYRLSFFTGNYITMTNMKDEDIDRLIKYRLEPINISIHATDEKTRCMMLNNKNAGKVLKYLEKLFEAGITINTQIVLCKGINDGDILEKTIKDLSKYAPTLKSICIVPVGLSKHRDGLYPLKLLTAKDCKDVISLVSKYQKQFKIKYNTPLVFLADEFYLKANEPVPLYKEYGNFDQIEDGIGMVSLFDYEFKKECDKLKRKFKNKSIALENSKKVTIITGKIVEKYMQEKVNDVMKILPFLNISVLSPVNEYFGKNITVTGLLTGIDIQKSVKQFLKDGNDIGEYIVLPKVCLKEDEDIFLDNTSLEDLACNIKSKIVISDGSAKSFIESFLVDVPGNYNIYKMPESMHNCSYENSIKF